MCSLLQQPPTPQPLMQQPPAASATALFLQAQVCLAHAYFKQVLRTAFGPQRASRYNEWTGLDNLHLFLVLSRYMQSTPRCRRPWVRPLNSWPTSGGSRRRPTSGEPTSRRRPTTAGLNRRRPRSWRTTPAAFWRLVCLDDKMPRINFPSYLYIYTLT